MMGAAGGAKKFNMSWKLGFFVAGCCTAGAGIIGVLNLALTTFAPFDLINELYLMLFGVLMLVIDFPVPHPKVQSTKLTIYKYLLFMTRFTGRGIWYMFLGTMIFASLWDLGICPFLGFILGGYVVILGGVSIFYGVQKSIKLEQVRKAVQQRGSSTEHLCPPGGLAPGQFNEMANSLKGVKFSEEELGYIVNALSFTVKADNLISKDEFIEWTKGRMTVL
jgi:hypothetical protein